MLRYTSILFVFPSGERCTFALIGDLCVFSALNSARLSYVSGASITNRCSSGIDILLNLFMSITLLRYPSARFIVFYQLSCTGFHPCSPPGNSTLLMYSQSFFSCSVYVFFSFGIFMSQCMCFGPGVVRGVVLACGIR